MKLIVLAAGRGRRMEGLTDDRPKCLMDPGDGSTLLSRLLLQASLSERIDEAVVCAGYRADAVEAEIGRWTDRMPVSVRVNPWFATSGPIASLWFARDLLGSSDFMICNGDTFYAREAFEALPNGTGHGFRIAVDPSRLGAPDGMRVALDPDGSLRRVGKDLPAEETVAVSAGLFGAFGPGARSGFVDVVIRSARQDDGQWSLRTWHSLLNDLTEMGEAVEPSTIPPGSWWEVDTARDLARLRNRVERIGQARVEGS